MYVPVRWQPHHSFYQQNGAGKGVDRTEQITYTRPEAEELVERWSDTVLRIAWTWTGSVHDAQDICQTVLLKLLTSPRRFAEERLERAWVVRVAVNCCKDWKKSAWVRRRDVDGLHGQSGQHVSLPGQGKIAEHAGRRLWTGMLIRVSWTRYS